MKIKHLLIVKHNEIQNNYLTYKYSYHFLKMKSNLHTKKMLAYFLHKEFYLG